MFTVENTNNEAMQELTRINEAIAHYEYELSTQKAQTSILELKLENIKKLQKEILKLV